MASDARLLRASLRGDHDAFGQIVRRYQSLVCAITHSGTGDLAASEDLAQETFLTAWERLASLREPARLRAWLCTIARNRTTDYLRRRQHDVVADAAPVHEAAAVESPAANPAEQAARKERERLVWAALQDVPETYRVPLVLFYREGQSVRRVAREMDLTRAAVKRRLLRGRGMLRDKVPALVEDTLSTTAPGSTFAAAVLAGLAGTAAKKGAGAGATILGLSLAKATAVGVLAVGVGLGAAVAPRPGEPPPAPVPAAVPTSEPAEKPAEPMQQGLMVHGVVVDEEGAPVAGARVNALGSRAAPEDAVTAADGSFALRIDTAMQYGTEILASAQARRSQGLYRFGNGPARVPPVRIVLRPARRVEVTVTDGQGEPVPGAVVETYDYYTTPLPGVETDEAGRAEMPVPADANIRWIVGFKPGVGFDYFENYTSWPPPQDLGVPASAHLVLDGATTVHVTAIDSGWKFIKGVEFVPWTIQKEGKVAWANVSGSRTLAARGDDDGVATFDCIPSTRKGLVHFLVQDERFHCPDLPRLRPDDPAGELTAVLLRNVPLSGKVFLPDGSPAAGTLVQAEGRGNTNMYCRTYARTAEDGSYSMWVYADQSYIVAVLDDDRAAPSRTGLIVREGEPVERVDFRLGPGTLIHGTVRIGQDRRPAARKTVALIQHDPSLPEEFRRSPEEQAKLVRWTETDDAGRYWFRAARGEFTLMVQPDDAEQSLTVEDQAEIVHDFLLEEPGGGE